MEQYIPRCLDRIKGAFIVILCLHFVVGCYGQQVEIKVVKNKCTYDNKNSGWKLAIHYIADTAGPSSVDVYWMEKLIGLPDNVKLRMVEKLLEYENDSSLCCMGVIARSFNGMEGCGGIPKNVSRYTIQVDALYMINRLCWPKSMERYSCVPVLYDTLSKRAINSDQKKIKMVFAAYKKWYAGCKTKGRIGDDFPFNDGRYVWYGGKSDKKSGGKRGIFE